MEGSSLGKTLEKTLAFLETGTFQVERRKVTE